MREVTANDRKRNKGPMPRCRSGTDRRLKNHLDAGGMRGESSREEVPDAARYKFREKPFKQGGQNTQPHGKPRWDFRSALVEKQNQ